MYAEIVKIPGLFWQLVRMIVLHASLQDGITSGVFTTPWIVLHPNECSGELFDAKVHARMHILT